ncbi:hypothetical protein [Lysinibacillus capsici]|uniref:hypothetical protein n=1 Tax=Lysinibacillus capsici TaxID=2115968 RepID=UPI0028AA6DCE|nr:hypothetical protein [Lysinibacillus capsici]
MGKIPLDVNRGGVDKDERGLPWWMYVIIVLLILITPGILALFMEFKMFKYVRGGIDGWLSYWGAYLGGIIGLIAIVGTTQFLISTQKNLHKEQLSQQDSHQKNLIEEQQQQHKEMLEQQNDHHIKLINEQKQQHKEQLEQQNAHHTKLINEQRQQHKEQLEQQRRAIEDSAKLQDKTERERYILQLDLRKTEEFSLLLIEIGDHLRKIKYNAFKCMDMFRSVANRYGSFTIALLSEDLEGKIKHENGYKKDIEILNTLFTNYSNLTLDIDKIFNNLLIIYNIADELKMLDFRSELRDGINFVSDNLHEERRRFDNIKNNKDLETKLDLIEFIEGCDSTITKNDKSIEIIIIKLQDKKDNLLKIQNKLLDKFCPKESIFK